MERSQLTGPVAVPADAPAAAPLRRLREAFEAHGLLVFVGFAYLAEQVALLRRLLTSDGWLTLLSGREIARHGLPSTDRLALLTHGRDWVDQQWLAQLLFYELHRAGGVPLVLVASLALAAGSLLAALLLALRRGASTRVVAWVVLVSLVPFGRAADDFRAQSLCYPLFVALLFLLSEEERRPGRRRVFLVLPLLVLWANLHGSVVAAAALVSLYGLLGPMRRSGRRARGLALAVLPWACVLASPYALELPAYYRTVLVNPAFASYVTEWKPATLSILDAPIFVLVLATAFLLGRRVRSFALAEGLILVACGLLALHAVRNGVWLALACVAFLPAHLDGVLPAYRLERSSRRMNTLLATSATVALVAAVAATAGRPTSWFTRGFPEGAATATAAAAGARGPVLATEDFADWLLWERPELAGRIAFDDRFELLHARELRTIFEIENGYSSPRALRGGYSVFVGSPTFAKRVESRLGRPLRRVYSSPSVVVLELRQ